MVLHLVCERVGSRHHSPAPRQNNVAGRGFLLGGEDGVFGCLRLCCLGVGDFCLLRVAVCSDTHPCALGDLTVEADMGLWWLV